MGKLILDMFHQNRLDLNQEVNKHPKLMQLLFNHPVDEFEIRLAEIASYCNVILHGDYSKSDLDKLCEVLYKKLVEKRTPFILNTASIPPEVPPGDIH